MLTYIELETFSLLELVNIDYNLFFTIIKFVNFEYKLRLITKIQRALLCLLGITGICINASLGCSKNLLFSITECRVEFSQMRYLHEHFLSSFIKPMLDSKVFLSVWTFSLAKDYYSRLII